MKVKSSKNQFEMQDPTKQYPAPKFPKQEQPVPGLAQKMDPKPDHGEESYKGIGRLMGRKALITGADSGIGRLPSRSPVKARTWRSTICQAKSLTRKR
jgi:hypothetical protein